MKEKTKEFLKKYLIGFILGFVSVGIAVVYAETYFPSNDVTYDNKESGLSSTDVQGAIDELYGVCTALPAGEQIIEDAGLEKDPYECRYFFTGVNPNNYVTFNGETAGWRIISVECDGTIKIMKTANINTSNNLAWDTSNSIGNNNWARPAELNVYLNNTYYNSLNSESQKQMVLHDWSIGSIKYEEYPLETQINKENSEKWNGKIALPTLSEYFRTNSEVSCRYFPAHTDMGNPCLNSSWMYSNNFTWWTLTKKQNSDYAVFSVYTTSVGNGVHAFDKDEGVRPTLYLSSEVKITGGTGTQADPYVLSP